MVGIYQVLREWKAVFQVTYLCHWIPLQLEIFRELTHQATRSALPEVSVSSDSSGVAGDAPAGGSVPPDPLTRRLSRARSDPLYIKVRSVLLRSIKGRTFPSS